MKPLLAIALVAILAEPASAGWRCTRPKQYPGPLPPPVVSKPTLKQVKAAVSKRTFVLGTEVTYALDFTATGPDDAAEVERCRTDLGSSGVATEPKQLGDLARCIPFARGITGDARRTWKSISAKRIPTALKPLAGDLSTVDKRHLIVTATTRDAAVLYVAHREDTQIVVETIIAAGSP